MKKKYVRGTTLEEHKTELMKNPKFRKAWEELLGNCVVMQSIATILPFLRVKVKASLTRIRRAVLQTIPRRSASLRRGGRKRESCRFVRLSLP